MPGKPLKVTHAICPHCCIHTGLDAEGRYVHHVLKKTDHPGWFGIDGITCDGSGLKANRKALRAERTRVRKLKAIEHRHAELRELRKRLQPEAEAFQAGQSINAEAFCGLLRAYSLWERVPPRLKGHVRKKLTCIQYYKSEILVIMKDTSRTERAKALVRSLVSAML